MPCSSVNLTKQVVAEQKTALDRLEALLAAGQVTVVVGAQGGIGFKGWNTAERAGLFDLCAYRKLTAKNSPALRKAIARAEAVSGRTVSVQAVNSGLHTHDEGNSWSRH